MDITIYSVLMAILWYSLFSFIYLQLMKHTPCIHIVSIWSMIAIAGLCLVRGILPFELAKATVIPSAHIWPFMRNILRSPFLFGLSTLYLLLIVWVLGSLFSLVRLIIQHLLFRTWLSHQPKFSNEGILKSIKAVLPKYQDFSVYKTNRIRSPMVTGFSKPIFLFPDYAIPSGYTTAILKHEYFHYKNKDLVAKLIFRILSCFLWWNPFSHMIIANLDHCLELNCDRAIVYKMSRTERVNYYKMLLDIHGLSSNLEKPHITPFSTGLISASTERQLRQRFEIGLRYSPAIHTRIIRRVVLLFAVSILVLSYLFIIQPSSLPNTEPNIFEITAENSYLVPIQGGTYNLFVDNEFRLSLNDPSILESEPFSLLPIYEGELQ